jgi:hypothetical protein
MRKNLAKWAELTDQMRNRNQYGAATYKPCRCSDCKHARHRDSLQPWERSVVLESEYLGQIKSSLSLWENVEPFTAELRECKVGL